MTPASPRWRVQLLEEARLGEVPAHDVTADPETGLFQVRSRDRGKDGHPALAYLEAEENLGAAGCTAPGPTARRVWSAYLPSGGFDLVAADGIEGHIASLADAGPDRSAAHERFVQWYRRRASGDVDACAHEIEDARRRLRTPFRYEFSASLDAARKRCAVNLFLPQKAVVTLVAGDVPDAPTFNERYSQFACRLGISTLLLFKENAPWAKVLSLNAWYRGLGGDGRCLFSVDADEKALLELGGIGPDDDALAALRSLRANLHRARSKDLMSVAPTFPLQQGADYLFGFEALEGGWTLPWRGCTLTDGLTSAELGHLTDRLEGLLAKGDLETACDLGASIERRAQSAWLSDVPDGMRALSPNSAFESLHSRRLLAGEKTCEVGKGLSHFYVVYAAVFYGLDDAEAARRCLDAAHGLDPAFPEPLFGLADLAFEEGDDGRACELTGAAFEVSYLARDLAHSYCCWAEQALSDDRVQDAASLFTYALGVSQDSGTLEQAVAGLARCREAHGYEPHAEFDPLTHLVLEGYPLHASKQVFDTAAPAVEDALASGPLPDASVLAAYVNGRGNVQPPSGALADLLLAVLGDRLGRAACRFYLYRPIAVDARGLAAVLRPACELEEYDVQGSPLELAVIPYVARDGALSFDVVATVGAPGEVGQVFDAGTTALDGTEDMEGRHFRLLRDVDYPQLGLDGRAELLARCHPRTARDILVHGLAPLDALRSFSYPGDVLALLRRPGVQSEGVWTRPDAVVSDTRLSATLVSEPFDEFGLHAGDSCVLELVRDRRVAGNTVALVERPDGTSL